LGQFFNFKIRDQFAIFKILEDQFWKFLEKHRGEFAILKIV
jgi:hypothetical protein